MKQCPTCRKEFPDDANFCPEDAAQLTALASKPSDFGGRFLPTDDGTTSDLGTVYMATDSQTKASCTVTVVAAGVLTDASAISRAERELKQLGRVEHKSVGDVLGYGKFDNTVWFATESLPGQTLEETVRTGGAMPVETAAAVLTDIIEGAAEAAKLGVIHRDLGPKNIAMSPSGAKLVNFAAPVFAEGGPNGVAEFLAPEQVDGKPVDQRSNIYSLGATFYFLVTARAPYQGDRASVLQAHKTGNPTPPSAFGAADSAADSVILKALQVASSKRYMTLRQFLDAVRPLASASQQAAVSNQSKAAPSAGKAKSNDMAKTMMGMGAADLARLSAAANDVAQRSGGAPEVRTDVMAAAVNPPPASPSAKANLAPPLSRSVPAAATPPVRSAAGSSQPAPLSKGIASAPPPSIPDPAVPAPAVPAPAVAKGGGKGKAKAPEAVPQRGKKKGFRETLWFKKGELDEVAAEHAAKAAAQGRDDVTEKADSMDIEDRYKDDGTVTKKDRDRLSLKTGETMMLSSAPDLSRMKSDVSEAELLAEMRGNRKWVAGGVILAVIAAVVIAMMIS